MMTRLAALALLAVSLSGCLMPLGPQHQGDLAALDACASRHDQIQEDVSTEVWWSLLEGHTLAGTIGGMEIIARRHQRVPPTAHVFPPDAPEVWYVRMTSPVGSLGPAHPLGYTTAIEAGPRLTELRQCLSAKGYAFSEPSAPPRPVVARRPPPATARLMACVVEARATGADPKDQRSAYWTTFDTCFARR
jgi:hypothetical protein